MDTSASCSGDSPSSTSSSTQNLGTKLARQNLRNFLDEAIASGDKCYWLMCGRGVVGMCRTCRRVSCSQHLYASFRSLCGCCQFCAEKK